MIFQDLPNKSLMFSRKPFYVITINDVKEGI